MALNPANCEMRESGEPPLEDTDAGGGDAAFPRVLPDVGATVFRAGGMPLEASLTPNKGTGSGGGISVTEALAPPETCWGISVGA